MSASPAPVPAALDADQARFLERLVDAVVVADREMRIRHVNAATERLVGCPRSALVGAPLTVIVPERLREAHTEAFQRFVRTGHGRLVGGPALRVPVLQASGDEVPADMRLSTLGEDGDAEPVIVATLRDVREQLQLEAQTAVVAHLQASIEVAARLERAQSTREALLLVLPELCTRLDWDVATVWEHDRITGRLHCFDVWYDDLPGAERFVAASRATVLSLGEGLLGECARARRPVAVADFGAEARFPRHESARAGGLTCAVAFPIVSSGAVVGAVELLAREPRTIGEDLLEVLASIGRQLGQFLERLSAETELRRREARYRSLVEATAMDVWSADATGGLVDDMPRWRTVTGQRRDDLHGSGWLDAVVDADRERVRAVWRSAIERKSLYECEYRIADRNGEEHVLIARGVPILEDGEVREWVGTTLEVTAQRQTEAARIALADALQRSLLPPHLPSVPRLDLASAYRAGGDGLVVGGDFYDVFALSDDTWDIAIGDVCGKGAEAAAVTALARYTLRAAAVHERSPARVLGELNKALLREESTRPFLTALYLRVRIDPTGVRVRLAAAGHPLPLLVRAADRTVTPVGLSGTLVGVLDEIEASDVTVELAAGDTLLLFTDGITEARDAAGREFGEVGLEAVLRQCAGCPAAETVRRVEQAVLEFRSGRTRDDVAMLAVQARG